MGTFIQKYGAFILATVMAIVTAAFANGVVQNTQKFHAEQITDARHKLDKLNDTVGTMREEQARMGAQISYLVQLCGDRKGHARAALSLGPTNLADNNTP